MAAVVSCRRTPSMWAKQSAIYGVLWFAGDAGRCTVHREKPLYYYDELCARTCGNNNNNYVLIVALDTEPDHYVSVIVVSDRSCWCM